jgi:hypothetical protein
MIKGSRFLLTVSPKFVFAALPLFLLLQSCKKDEPNVQKALNSEGTGTTAALDTSGSGKPVDFGGKLHYISLTPKAGTTQRFRVRMKRTVGVIISDQLFGGPQGKKNSTTRTDMWIRQTVKSVKPDSSIDFTYRLDSVLVQSEQDTQKVSYNSGNAQDRKDTRFQEYNVMVGQEFGAIVTNHGDITEIYGINGIVNTVLKDSPDSVKTDQNKSMVSQQVKMLLGQYITQVNAHVPAKPLAKDTSWSVTAESNLPVAPSVQFPIKVESKETVTGFEERGGAVLARFDAVTTVTPIKPVLTQADATARLKNFSAGLKSTTFVDDVTGILVHRSVTQKRNYVFTLESAKQPGKLYSSEENTMEESSVDLLQ